MLLAYAVLPIKIVILFPFNLFGICLVFIGVLISFLGSNKFEQEKTTVMTFDTPVLMWNIKNELEGGFEH